MSCCANTIDPEEIERQKVEAILEHVSREISGWNSLHIAAFLTRLFEAAV